MSCWFTVCPICLFLRGGWDRDSGAETREGNVQLFINLNSMRSSQYLWVFFCLHFWFQQLQSFCLNKASLGFSLITADMPNITICTEEERRSQSITGHPPTAAPAYRNIWSWHYWVWPPLYDSSKRKCQKPRPGLSFFFFSETLFPSYSLKSSSPANSY